MSSLLDALSDSENTIDLQDENLITPIHEFLEINPEKRLITIPESEQLFGVYGENKVEVKYFKCPRIILNDIDLYECYIFINYISASGKIGYIQVDTVVLDETENYIIFTWELTRNVFDKNIDTDIYFSISAKQYLEDKEPVFFTRKAKGNLYETIYAEEQITEQYADIILQLLAEMNGLKQIATPEAMQDYVDDWLKENPQKIGGQPVPAKSASEIQNTQTLYLYMGDGETIDGVSYERGYTYYYSEKTKKWIKGIYYGLIEDMLVSRTSGTEIVVTDGADAPFGDFNLYGKGEQVEYSGKNLLGAVIVKTSATFDNTTGLLQGLATSNTTVSMAKVQAYKDGTFVENLIIIDTEGKKVFSLIKYDTFNQIKIGLNGDNQDQTIIFDISHLQDGTTYYLQFNISAFIENGGTISNIMITTKSEYDEVYEPYVGGIPSPNPDFPQEIVNVGKYNETTGKYEVEVIAKGKQMFKYPFGTTTKTENGITFTDNGDGTLTLNGTATKDADFTFVESVGDTMIKAEKGTKYAMSCECSGSVDGNVSFTVQDITYKQTTFFYVNQYQRAEFTAKYEQYYSWIRVKSGTVVNNYTVKPMLRRADIGDDTFEPYKSHTEILESSQPFRGSKDGTVRDSRSFDGDVRRIASVGENTPINSIGINSEEKIWRIYLEHPAIPYNAYTKGLCTHYLVANSYKEIHDATIPMISVNANGDILIKDSSLTTEDEVTSLLSSNGFEFAYPLKTPIIEPLSETELAKLRRLATFNPTTIFTADGGEMELMYANENDVWKYILQNFVSKSEYDDLKARVLILEQNMLS